MTAEPDAPRLVPEKTADDAPSWYGAVGASAWANGWNACAQSVATAPAVQPAAGQSDWSDEDAKRYIADWCPDYVKDYIDRLAAISTPAQASGPKLKVWYGSMPESNGRQNWTAILGRRDDPSFDLHVDGFCFARSEYPGRVLYEADEMRWIIGELPDKPDILAYDANTHSGYAHPPAQASETGGEVERLLREGWAEEAFRAGHTVSGRRWEAADEETKGRYRRYVDGRLDAALSAPQAAPGSQHDDHEDDEAFHPKERDHD